MLPKNENGRWSTGFARRPPRLQPGVQTAYTIQRKILWFLGRIVYSQRIIVKGTFQDFRTFGFERVNKYREAGAYAIVDSGRT